LQLNCIYLVGEIMNNRFQSGLPTLLNVSNMKCRKIPLSSLHNCIFRNFETDHSIFQYCQYMKKNIIIDMSNIFVFKYSHSGWWFNEQICLSYDCLLSYIAFVEILSPMSLDVIFIIWFNNKDKFSYISSCWFDLTWIITVVLQCYFFKR